ncbi:MAG: hypothetical protein IPJ78_01970 [Gemmatimonadetes bacterium]|nr:hypothetical protein [Gemmatimonadota bacterium]
MIRPHRRRAGRRAVLAACAALGIAVACADLGTGLDEVSYIAFDRIPYPALIAGDTMRDSLGAAAPLRASAFDAGGREITGAAFTYLTLDTGVTIDADGFLRATTRRDGTVRLVASFNGLQTDDRTVRVTRRPDSLLTSGATALSLSYVIPDVAATNISPELRVSLVSRDTVGVGPAVGGWLVRWTTVHGTDTLGVTDTTLVALQTANGARRSTDTTAADGSASRRLRVFANRLTVAVDSFVVLADVRLHGVRVPGSPVRFVVRIAPPAAP